jgi:uncharacterized protein YbaP (TraB family)
VDIGKLQRDQRAYSPALHARKRAALESDPLLLIDLAGCASTMRRRPLGNFMERFVTLLGCLRSRIAALAAAVLLAAPPALAEPALWIVKDKDSTIYLFGTVHILRPDTAWRSPKIEAAFNAADELWLEIPDVSSLSAQLVGGFFTLRYGLSPSRPLSSRLTREEYAILDKAARTAGFTAQSLNAFRPWLASMLIQTSSMVEGGFDANSGVEMKLTASSRTRKIPVKGFETIEQQLRIFADLPEEDELAMLRETLETFAEGAEGLDDIVSEWIEGDVAAIEKMVVADMLRESPAVYDALLKNRNANWAAKIEEMLKGSGVAFVAVGAAHLVGPHSVQAHLKARGIASARH